MAQFERKHRQTKRAKRSMRTPIGAQRFRQTGEGIVVQDFDGSEVFRIGTYGQDIGDEDTRGLVVSDISGNATAELNQDQVSLGNPIIGSVQSDNVVTVGNTIIQRFVDPEYGSDINGDGLSPISLSDNFTRTVSSGWGCASDGFTAQTGLTGANATDIFTLANHGYVEGDQVQLYSLTGGTGITAGALYYVLSTNLAANTFQLSTTRGGTALNFTTDVTAGTVQKTYHVWTREAGTAANFSAAPSYLAIAAAASTEYVMRLNGGGAMCEEFYWEFQADKAPSTGTLDFGFLFRAHNKINIYTNGGEAILCRMAWTTTAAAPKAQIYSDVDGVYTQLATTDLPAVFAVNTTYKARAQVYDKAGTTYIRLRVWKGTDTEPATWTVSGANGVCSTSVTDQTYITSRGGQIGVRQSAPAFANGPITTKLTAFTYTVLDPQLLEADDSDTAAGTYHFTAATSLGPYATVSRAIKDIPQYNNGTVYICIDRGQADSPGTGTPNVLYDQVNIQGIVGGGLTVITGPNTYWIGGIAVNGCNNDIVISGMTLSDAGGNQSQATICVNVSRYVELYQMIMEGNTATTDCNTNVLFTQGSNGIVSNCQMHGAAAYCLTVQGTSNVYAESNTGTGPTNSYRVLQSILQFNKNSVPTGGLGIGTTAMAISNGTGTNTDVTSALDAATTGGGTTPTGSTKKTATWKATGSATYGMTYGTWASGDVTQGSYGGSQNHKGLWKYPDAVQTTLSGKTIDAGYITVKRASGNGASSAQPIYLATFNISGSITSGDPGNPVTGPTLIGSLAWGETKTFAVPVAILNDLKTASGGHTRGLGIFQSDGSPYVTLLGVGNYSGSGALKITYH